MLALALALILAASPAAADDGTAANAIGNASAGIIQPITVEVIEDLQFGTLAVGPDTGGTMTVDPASGTTSYSGGLVGVCGTGGCQAHPAVFGVTGEPGRRYRVDAPTSAVAQPVTGNGPSLPVSDLRIAIASLPGPDPVGRLDAAGKDRFLLGGTLQVTAGSAPGFYRADVSVVVTYD